MDDDVLGHRGGESDEDVFGHGGGLYQGDGDRMDDGSSSPAVPLGSGGGGTHNAASRRRSSLGDPRPDPGRDGVLEAIQRIEQGSRPPRGDGAERIAAIRKRIAERTTEGACAARRKLGDGNGGASSSVDQAGRDPRAGGPSGMPVEVDSVAAAESSAWCQGLGDGRGSGDRRTRARDGGTDGVPGKRSKTENQSPTLAHPPFRDRRALVEFLRGDESADATREAAACSADSGSDSRTAQAALEQRVRDRLFPRDEARFGPPHLPHGSRPHARRRLLQLDRAQDDRGSDGGGAHKRHRHDAPRRDRLPSHGLPRLHGSSGGNLGALNDSSSFSGPSRNLIDIGEGSRDGRTGTGHGMGGTPVPGHCPSLPKLLLGRHGQPWRRDSGAHAGGDSVHSTGHGCGAPVSTAIDAGRSLATTGREPCGEPLPHEDMLDVGREARGITGHCSGEPRGATIICDVTPREGNLATGGACSGRDTRKRRYSEAAEDTYIVAQAKVRLADITTADRPSGATDKGNGHEHRVHGGGCHLADLQLSAVYSAAAAPGTAASDAPVGSGATVACLTGRSYARRRIVGKQSCVHRLTCDDAPPATSSRATPVDASEPSNRAPATPTRSSSPTAARRGAAVGRPPERPP